MTSRTNGNSSMPIRYALVALSLTAAVVALASPASAQRMGFRGYTEQSGKEVYGAICQGCHMSDGKGAQGAGVYPSLTANPKMAAKSYPALVIVRGQKAMPEFGSGLTDEQVAAVVNYIRTEFGNSYTDPITAADVKPLRPARPVTGTIRPPG